MKTIVQRIHRAYNTASDGYLTDITATNSKKQERCKNVGFPSVDVDVLKKNSVLTEKHKIVQKYALKYPAHKFIFREDVDKINKTYDLVCDMSMYYKGSIPEKNLVDVEQFMKHDKMKPGLSIPDRLIGSMLVDDMSLYIYAFILLILTPWAIFSGYQFPSPGQIISKSEFLINILFCVSVIAFFVNLTHEADHSWFSVIFKNSFIKTMKNNFFICAPRKDFTKFWDDGNELKDPIVLKAVEFEFKRGRYRPTGYIIVTAWGDEAMDGKVFNERNN